MSNQQVVSLDTLRTLAFGSTSGTYAAVGGVFAHPVRLIMFTNNTDGDMLFSDDSINDKVFVAGGAFVLFDLNTNKYNLPQWVMPKGTQWYVKQTGAAPTSGSVYITCLWGE